MTDYRVHLTVRSRNAKTGAMPVSTTGRKTCPIDCPFSGAGCYAASGPLSLHWDKVSSGQTGGGWSEFISAVKSEIFPTQLWRHNQAGDLPGDGVIIDANALTQLIEANSGKRGYTYTHYDVSRPENARAVSEANRGGFTVNVSANDLSHADQLSELAVGPVVVVVPESSPDRGETPGGRPWVVCPAQTDPTASCATCALCQKRERKIIVAFKAHGARKKAVSAMVACAA